MGIRALSFLFEKFFACGLASWCFRHFGGMVRLLRFLFPSGTLNAWGGQMKRWQVVSRSTWGCWIHECIAVDRRHQCHHRSIRQIGSTLDLYFALFIILHYYLLFKIPNLPSGPIRFRVDE